MYPSLLFLHSLFRWLVLTSLLGATVRAYRGYAANSVFTKTDDSIRHWTATLAHIQLIIGFTLYIQSPVVKSFFAHFSEAVRRIDTAFFGVIHLLFMLASIVIITIGSALAKRKPTDREKFRTVLVWFSIALLIIFLAIPWPFSPFANRPYFRAY
ncbi:MAG: hypothetical protein H7Z72_12565 [Bacteroidetes bacterium]|nr:hypothetical protein [Fibrella sp.]